MIWQWYSLYKDVCLICNKPIEAELAFFLPNQWYILSISPELQGLKFIWLVKKNVAYFACRKGKPHFQFLCECCLSQWSGCAVSIAISSEDEVKLGRLLVWERQLLEITRSDQFSCQMILKWMLLRLLLIMPYTWNKSTNIYLLFVPYSLLKCCVALQVLLRPLRIFEIIICL